MVTVKSKTDSNKHNQKRCSVSRAKKHKHTCLNTTCLEYSRICLKHTDEKRPLIEAHYNEFNIWDQQIPAQISETHMANKLYLEKTQQNPKPSTTKEEKDGTPNKAP